MANKVERDLRQECEIARGPAITHTAVVLTESDVQHQCNAFSIDQCIRIAAPRVAGSSAPLDRKQRISLSTLSVPLRLRMVSTASTVRSPGHALRASRAAALVLANTRRRTRRPWVSSKASQLARPGAPQRKQCGPVADFRHLRLVGDGGRLYPPLSGGSL